VTGPLLLDLVLLVLVLHGLADLDDPDLARRIRKGDHDAFRTFFDRYHGLLFRYLRRRGVSQPVSEDLIQVAFLTIWERRGQIDPDKSLRSFLFRIAHNRALNHFRDTAKFTDAPDRDDPVTSTAPDRNTDYAFMQAALREAIAALPERRRAVFELCFLHDLTYRETAEVLGVSIKTVENQMGHALKAVRKALAGFL
jgi:RNA polymerase sigma-70 factor (ECF subfamily)